MKDGHHTKLDYNHRKSNPFFNKRPKVFNDPWLFITNK